MVIKKLLLRVRREVFAECPHCGYSSTDDYSFDRVKYLKNAFRRKDEKGFWCPKCNGEVYIPKIHRATLQPDYTKQKSIQVTP